VGSDAGTCATTLDPASLLERDRVLPHVTRLRTPPSLSGGLQCCHVSYGFGPRLPTWESSSADMCHTTLDPISLLKRAPVLPHAPRLRTLPPCSGRLQCCHVPVTLKGLLALRIKKCLTGLPMRLGSCVFKACQHVSETPNT
jgi:hypothetical protein